MKEFYFAPQFLCGIIIAFFVSAVDISGHAIV